MLSVIACDKRVAFAQESEATKQSIYLRAERWIASLAAMTAKATAAESQPPSLPGFSQIQTLRAAVLSIVWTISPMQK